MSLKHSYKNKTDQELYRILKGIGNTTYEQKKIAQEQLVERNFDFEHITKHKNKWELERITKELKEEKNNFIFLNFWGNPDFLKGFSIFIFAITPFVAFSFIQGLLKSNDIFVIENIASFFIIILNLTVGIGILKYSKTRRDYIKNRNKKLIELKK